MQFFIRFRLLDNFRGFVDFGVSYVLVRQNVRLRIVNIMTDGGRWKLIFFFVNLYKNTSPTANINLSIICSYSSYIGTIKNKRHISFACSIFPWYISRVRLQSTSVSIFVFFQDSYKCYLQVIESQTSSTFTKLTIKPACVQMWSITFYQTCAKLTEKLAVLLQKLIFNLKHFSVRFNSGNQESIMLSCGK